MIPDISLEIEFQTARSGGKGGQNVNKVESMVQGRWYPDRSAILTDDQKTTVLQRLAHLINSDGAILLKSQEDRSQLGNKEKVIAKFRALLEKALTKKKVRIATRATKASREKRIEAKKLKGTVKANRKKVRPGNWD